MSVVNIGKTALARGFLAGHGTIGNAEDKISIVNFEVQKQIVIRANAANTSTISIGPPGEAANGFILAAGETSPPIYVDETDKVRVYGGAAGQNFSWVLN